MDVFFSNIHWGIDRIYKLQVIHKTDKPFHGMWIPMDPMGYTWRIIPFSKWLITMVL